MTFVDVRTLKSKHEEQFKYEVLERERRERERERERREREREIVYTCKWHSLASFPGSTPQLFSHGARKAGEWSLGTRLAFSALRILVFSAHILQCVKGTLLGLAGVSSTLM